MKEKRSGGAFTGLRYRMLIPVNITAHGVTRQGAADSGVLLAKFRRGKTRFCPSVS